MTEKTDAKVLETIAETTGEADAKTVGAMIDVKENVETEEMLRKMTGTIRYAPENVLKAAKKAQIQKVPEKKFI